MGLPVTVYRSTDAGAPQLVTGKPSSWINILKKVLVEGYGTKSPLGWTIEFEDTGTRSIVFRNSLTDGGSGCYVKFYSVGGTDNVYTTLGIKIAQSFTDINTFIKGLGARGIVNPSGYNSWEIIGTSRGFYIGIINATDPIVTSGTQTNATQYYFVGDIEASTPNDNSPFTIVNYKNSAGDDTSGGGLNMWNNTTYAQFNTTDGSAGTAVYSFLKSTFFQPDTTPQGNAELLGINHTMVPVLICGATSQNSSVSMPFVRGKVPGLYNSTFAGYRTESWPYDITQDGVKWVLVKAAYCSAQLWINAGEWYV
ncbi:hypothetical protein [Shewanella xiamenensis]|uniref:hypothetical protein n=1 Tax=Shewanella xiamenensis TaxID=332186 RepID=UPI0021BEF28E|nr:hypothetical protein [Shewanella xiamenensis]MCT8866317.1 hypothetical protein [Shewanella xiamenensis]